MWRGKLPVVWTWREIGLYDYLCSRWGPGLPYVGVGRGSSIRTLQQTSLAIPRRRILPFAASNRFTTPIITSVYITRSIIIKWSRKEKERPHLQLMEFKTTFFATRLATSSSSFCTLPVNKMSDIQFLL
jgi:hypothetical protein